MAPFNTHFLVAEQIWPQLAHYGDYGQFCFGCVAPDVDKISATLTQKETHFNDRFTDYELMVTHRSVTFLQQQATFLAHPFAELAPSAQAFVLGYLCHLCVDEVTKHLWRRDVYEPLQNVTISPMFAALDEWAKQQIQHHGRIVAAIQSSQPLPNVIPLIPATDLAYYAEAINQFIIAPNTEAEFLVLADTFGRVDPIKRQQRHEQFLAEIDLARHYVPQFHMAELIDLSLIHSRRRFADLINGHVPLPGYPF
jgi:hypothetical protein